MKTFHHISKMRDAVRAERAKGGRIGFVPTLGFLHEGHEALIAAAMRDNDVVVVSRFVNPLQFRKKAFGRYPRDEARDAAICDKNGVDYLFSPGVEEMYPEGFDTRAEVMDLTGRLEGGAIRWHYRGVVTVVVKLLNIVQPDTAYFGKKDAHQLAIIKRFVKDLNIPVEIRAVATRRAKDGLALSSRNSLLTPEERKAAVVIPDAIKAIGKKLKSGYADYRALGMELEKLIEKEPKARVDFTAVVDAETLREEVSGPSAMIYAAVFIGGKRLTDNLVVKLGPLNKK
ncbi:MAG: pantoate--beta-alanine ligase [Nitrospinae bacterium]|nr:pantoate--beta-alanine ligase [Nitrospinota bacterium]